MEKVTISASSLHYRFIMWCFNNRINKEYIYEPELNNSCQYLTALVKSFLHLLLKIVLFVYLVYSFTEFFIANVVVSYTIGVLSTGILDAVLGTSSVLLGITFSFYYATILAFLVGGATVVACLMYAKFKEKYRQLKYFKSEKQISNSPLFSIVKAKIDKICIPIQIEEDEVQNNR